VASLLSVDDIVSELPRRLHEVVDKQSASAPTQPAVVDHAGALSFEELRQATVHAATRLAELGVRAGDRVMVVSENCIAAVVLLLAMSRLDVWTIIVNPRLSRREIEQIREHSGTRLILFTSEVSSEAAAHAASYNATSACINGFSEIFASEINSDVIPEHVEKRQYKQVAVLIYTSGTTGTPKGVMLTHHNILFSARTNVLYDAEGSHHRVYVILPISHIAGFTFLVMSLMMGATARLVRRFEPARLAEGISNDEVSIFCGVPATYQRLLEYKDTVDAKYFRRGILKHMMVAGAPLDLTLKSRIEEIYEIPLLNGYGITECSPTISSVRPDAPKSDQTVGPLVAGVEGRIVKSNGSIATAGEVGELHVRGPNVMLGYYRAPDLTAAAVDSEGWFKTGDIARIDNSLLYIVGRAKEMIIRSGFNVYPAEVEAVLNSHPAVVQSAVVGKSVSGNEEVIAFVQFRVDSKVTVDDLASYIKSLLTPYKRPSQIIRLETLPATTTGKILKSRLADSLLLTGNLPEQAHTTS
jgi:acyl-CoA synthetase (AMP-forming)/AMP-acid ligase II